MNKEKKKLKKYEQKKEFIKITEDLIDNEDVKRMKLYRHHYSTTCYQHCLEVSFLTYKICKKLRWDYSSAARAGLLHDFFLYDWRKPHETYGIKGKHAFSHPLIALVNASKVTKLNDKERDIIVNHMWPVTIYRRPKYKETLLITLIDKANALKSLNEFYISLIKSHRLKRLPKTKETVRI